MQINGGKQSFKYTTKDFKETERKRERDHERKVLMRKRENNNEEKKEKIMPEIYVESFFSKGL